MSSEELRVLVYEGRRFLRPAAAPQKIGVDEMGLCTPRRILLITLPWVVYFLVIGFFVVRGYSSGWLLERDSVAKWVIGFSPLFPFFPLALIANRQYKLRLPDVHDVPKNSVKGSYKVGEDTPQRIKGRLEIVDGLIRIVDENARWEINRSEIEKLRVLEGAVRFEVPKYHHLPHMSFRLRPVQTSEMDLKAMQQALENIRTNIDVLPRSSAISTYPCVERPLITRPKGAALKSTIIGGAIALAVALSAMTFRPARPDDTLQYQVIVISVITLFGSCLGLLLVQGDVWMASNHNRWLRKKGIVKD